MKYEEFVGEIQRRVRWLVVRARSRWRGRLWGWERRWYFRSWI